MNGYLFVTGSLCALAFVAHAFVGDVELKVNKPGVTVTDEPYALKNEKWTMARCGWHMVSVDLLFAAVFLFVLCFNGTLAYKKMATDILALYFLTYAMVWLMVLFLSKQAAKNYLKLGQWLLLMGIAVLIFMGGTL